jgi:hypothetical protein
MLAIAVTGANLVLWNDGTAAAAGTEIGTL